MQRKYWLGKREMREGSASIEFAILSGLLFLLAMGAGDFARIFYNSLMMVGAAAHGSFHGAQSSITSGQFTAMKDTAEDDVATLPAQVTATGSRICDCPGEPPVEVDCVTGTCAGYGAPRVYVRTQAQQTFSPIFNWPGIPGAFPLLSPA